MRFVWLMMLGAAPQVWAQKGIEPYVPPRGAWESKAPAALGVNAAWLDSARAFHVKAEAKTPRDLEQSHYQSFGREPFGEAVGPFATRGTRADSSSRAATWWPSGAIRRASIRRSA